MSSDLEEDNKCSICLNSLTDSEVYKTQCGHSFHKDCFDQLKKKGFDTCPMCRAILAVADVRTNDNAVVNRIRHDSQSEREEERRLIHLALDIIKEVPNIKNNDLALILLGARGQTQINTVYEALKILYGSPDASPVTSPDVSPVASFQLPLPPPPVASFQLPLPPPPDASFQPPLPPVASYNARRNKRTGIKSVTKRDLKRVFNIAKKWKKLNPTTKPGGKTKKKGQRTHRRKKNTSRSL